MATSEQPAVSPCDLLAALREARREIDAVIAHVEAYLEDGEPGQALNAERVAGIVAATVEAAACDTRALARAALDEALAHL